MKHVTDFYEEFDDVDDGDDFIHVVETDESVTAEELVGENLEAVYVEEEDDLEHWSLTTCPKCRGKFDLTTCRTSGENIVCPHCHSLL